MIYTPDNGNTWAVPPASIIVEGVQYGTYMLERNAQWATLVAGGVYRQWTQSGNTYGLGYTPWALEPNPDGADGTPVAVRYLAGTAQEQATAHRQQLSDEIEANRMAADQQKIDVQRDPGIAVLMDEANANAEAKLVDLDATADEDLGAFDPAFHPLAVGAVATARSLVVQEVALSSDPSLTTEQQDDLAVAIALHQSVVDAGDDSANVDPVPHSVRRLIGTAGEDYGVLIARRVYSGGWWWLTFELQTTRELDVSEYWIALYLEGGAYLTTPQLTKTSDGVYMADATAVNIPTNDTSTAYEFTLCRGHIDAEQFAPVILGSGVERQRYRVRWGGNVYQAD